MVTVSSRWAHSDHGGDGSGAQWSRLGEVTAQSRRGHSSVTARSQLSHGEVTAQSRNLQYDHGSVMARSQLNHGPGHGSVTAGCDHFGHHELTLSSPWAVTVANFFLMGTWPTAKAWSIHPSSISTFTLCCCPCSILFLWGWQHPGYVEHQLSMHLSCGSMPARPQCQP